MGRLTSSNFKALNTPGNKIKNKVEIAPNSIINKILRYTEQVQT